MEKYDIAIIGGGIMGSSIAYFLARSGRAGSIVVIDPDPTYQAASTPQGAGGVRQLFSLPENIWMSQYSVEFFSNFHNTMSLEEHPALIEFVRQGYIFVASPKGARQLEANYHLQAAEGVQVELLSPEELQDRFPSLGTEDIAMASYSPTDGWIDPTSALQGFRRKATNLGVTYTNSRVLSLELKNQQVKTALLNNGSEPQADVFVNAAGAWAAEVAAMAGVELPIVPYCRVQHFWLCQAEIEPLPLVKDESGMFFRPEGPGYVGGRPSWEIEPGFEYALQEDKYNSYFGDYFEHVVWPLLVTRLPKFDLIREKRKWLGHYAQNTLDGNMILGPAAPVVPNFYMACGFSGHGFMHSPAVGLALSELILDGRYSTMDLSKMSYQRVLDQQAYKEMGII
ncbi:NAD(P)/FAD-dependent oxidoreductase [Chloroflexota bacterium]